VAAPKTWQTESVIKWVRREQKQDAAHRQADVEEAKAREEK
jgi:hypothetical protein